MRKIILLGITILFVAGCKVGKNYKGVELEGPDYYTYLDTTKEVAPLTLNIDTIVADSLANLDWFSIYNDPLLDTLVEMALTKNQDLLLAAESVNQALLGISVQRTEMLPNVGYQANISRGNFQNNQLGSTSNLYYGLGSVNWELDFWGKYRRLNEAAKAKYLSSEQAYRATKISLVSSVAKLYFILLENEMRLDVSHQTLALRDSMLVIIQARFDKGIIPEIDLNQAQIQRAIAAGSVPLIERRIAANKLELSYLLGGLPRSINTIKPLAMQDTAIHIPMGLPSDLLARRPDILLAEQELIAQNALVGVAQANRLPSISLTGILGIVGNDLANLNSGATAWNIGGSMMGPLFYWGRYKRLADIEQSKRVQSELIYERVVLNSFREVEEVLARINSLKTEIEARHDHVQASLRAQELSQQRYNEGVTSYLEYLESQRQAFEAQQNYAGTKQQLLSAYTDLYKALGGGWMLEN